MTKTSTDLPYEVNFWRERERGTERKREKEKERERKREKERERERKREKERERDRKRERKKELLYLHIFAQEKKEKYKKKMSILFK